MNYLNRLKNLQKAFLDKCEAFLIEDKTNLYYMTGLSLSSGSLLVFEKGAFLLVDNRYIEFCKKNSPFPAILSEDTPLHKFLSSQEFSSLQKIGFDSENTSYKRVQDFEKMGKFTWVPLNNPVKLLRMIKDEEEIDLLKDAALLGCKGYDFLLTMLREGISENQMAMELEIFWKREGSLSLAFDPIIAFGENSAMPHYRAGNRQLEKGLPALLDIGVNLNNYHSDMTRVVFFGEPPKKLERIYHIVESAHEKAVALCKVGQDIGTIDREVRNFIGEMGFGDYFKHGLGHGVGLEIHEVPILKATTSIPLQIGMVFTIEPGIYIPGLGGVRLENTYALTSQGLQNLTPRPTEIKIVN